ncbi:MAG: thiamine ABC transporter substrate-binding protein, partial [Deinococcales bacterium]
MSFNKVLALSLLFMVSLALAQERLRVLTHDSFVVSEALIEAFSQETGIEVTFIKGGDAGLSTNKAILTRA